MSVKTFTVPVKIPQKKIPQKKIPQKNSNLNKLDVEQNVEQLRR